jgi:hypothetical protein
MSGQSELFFEILERSRRGNWQRLNGSCQSKAGAGICLTNRPWSWRPFRQVIERRADRRFTKQQFSREADSCHNCPCGSPHTALSRAAQRWRRPPVAHIPKSVGQCHAAGNSGSLPLFLSLRDSIRLLSASITKWAVVADDCHVAAHIPLAID